MTVKEVFDLRKQGRIEEAYQIIRPMYAVHKGKYTTLCMFWTASDILKKRIKEHKYDEAEKIFKSLVRILPNIEDREGSAHRSIYYGALALDRKKEDFSILCFVEDMQTDQMSDALWQDIPTPPTNEYGDYHIPSMAQQLLNRAFKEIKESPTVDNALKVMPLLQEAMRRQPHNKENHRHMATIYRIMGEEEKALSMEEGLDKAEHIQMGIWGEDLSEVYLRSKGYIIIERDWHSDHRDIDIIARQNDTIVFVEVKTRRNADFIAPEQAVDYAKMRNLKFAINHYVKLHKINNPIRFDIITIVGQPDAGEPTINHIEDVNLSYK